MDQRDVEVAIVGAGAAGIAAARRLADAGRDVLLIEARDRIGGRSYTIHDPVGGALDLGCGWLHSGEVNPWTKIAEATGRTVDRTPPPWSRRTLEVGFPLESQQAFQAANEAFHARLDAASSDEADRPASELLAPGDPWNGLIDALSTYISGAELASVGVRDLTAYADTGVNWRVEGGYGALIASHAAGIPVLLGSPVKKIEHGGARIRIETASTLVTAEHAVVTLPSALIADEAVAFEPALPEKVEAARRLPLGLADKIYLALEDAEEFAPDARIFGRTDSVATAAYHFRAGGRPIVEGYFGGALARRLEGGGMAAFFDHAHAELTNVFGKAFGARIRPVAMHCWASDPFARGSYSYAVPGGAPARAALAASVGRLHFAGEACSEHDFSTAHGAYRTGLAAAENIIRER